MKPGQELLLAQLAGLASGAVLILGLTGVALWLGRHLFG